MTRPLEVRAEIFKLARLLKLDPSELSYLEQVPPDDVRQLREQVTDVLFSAQGNALGRLAGASKLLPVRVVATIGEKAFGPVLAARITGLLEPDRAVATADTMPIGFLADVAVELDPRRASQVISRIAPERIAAVTRELLRRGEYVAMGRFVGHLGEPALRAAVDVIDNASLLRIAFVLESKETLDHLVALLTPERRDALIDVAATEQLWSETLDLLMHLSDERCTELVANAARRDDAILDSLVLAAQQEEMWNAVLRTVRCMTDQDRMRFVRLSSINSDGVLESIVEAAAQYELWPQLLPLIRDLPADSQQRVARAAQQLAPDQRALVLAHLQEPERL